jgi:hypothetical protein
MTSSAISGKFLRYDSGREESGCHRTATASCCSARFGAAVLGSLNPTPISAARLRLSGAASTSTGGIVRANRECIGVEGNFRALGQC